MIIEKLPAVRDLSPNEKWLLAQELWNELIPEPEVSRDDAIERLIDERIADYRRNPASAVSWAVVKEKLHALKNG